MMKVWVLLITLVLVLTGCQSIEKQNNYAPKSVNHLVFVGKLKQLSRLQHNAIPYWQAALDNGHAKFYSIYDVKMKDVRNSGYYQYKRLSHNMAELDYAPTTGVTNPPLFGRFTFYFNAPNSGTFVAKIYTYKNNQPNIHAKTKDLKFLQDQQGTFKLIKHS